MTKETKGIKTPADFKSLSANFTQKNKSFNSLSTLAVPLASNACSFGFTFDSEEKGVRKI